MNYETIGLIGGRWAFVMVGGLAWCPCGRPSLHTHSEV